MHACMHARTYASTEQPLVSECETRHKVREVKLALRELSLGKGGGSFGLGRPRLRLSLRCLLLRLGRIQARRLLTGLQPAHSCLHEANPVYLLGGQAEQIVRQVGEWVGGGRRGCATAACKQRHGPGLLDLRLTLCACSQEAHGPAHWLRHGYVAPPLWRVGIEHGLERTERHLSLLLGHIVKEVCGHAHSQLLLRAELVPLPAAELPATPSCLKFDGDLLLVEVFLGEPTDGACGAVGARGRLHSRVRHDCGHPVQPWMLCFPAMLRADLRPAHRFW